MENFPEQWNVWQGSPVFPVGTLQAGIRFHFFTLAFDTTFRFSQSFFGKRDWFVQKINEFSCNARKKSPTFYKLNDNGIWAMNFETAWIHFLRDSFRHRRCLRCLSYLKTLLINLRYHCRQLLLLTFYWIKKGSKEKKLVECTFIVVSANVLKSLSNMAFFINSILWGTQDSALNWNKKRGKNGNNLFKQLKLLQLFLAVE